MISTYTNPSTLEYIITLYSSIIYWGMSEMCTLMNSGYLNLELVYKFPMYAKACIAPGVDMVLLAWILVVSKLTTSVAVLPA